MILDGPARAADRKAGRPNPAGPEKTILAIGAPFLVYNAG